MLVADATEAEIATHIAGANVSTANAVVAKAAQQDQAQLIALADTVNSTKKAADLQGEANAKGTIFALGAKLAAAHPNSADAQKAISAALSGGGNVTVTADVATVQCRTAVRQTVQQSGNSGGSAKLNEDTGVATCVAAQQAA